MFHADPRFPRLVFICALISQLACGAQSFENHPSGDLIVFSAGRAPEMTDNPVERVTQLDPILPIQLDHANPVQNHDETIVALETEITETSELQSLAVISPEEPDNLPTERSSVTGMAY